MHMGQPEEGDLDRPPKLLDKVRYKLRVLHLAKRTEEAYVSWIRRFLSFHRKPNGEWIHPDQRGGREVSDFLTHLAVDREVSASTQNQAFSALLFLFKRVLGKELTIDSVRAKSPERLPTVLSQMEVSTILGKSSTSIRRACHEKKLHWNNRSPVLARFKFLAQVRTLLIAMIRTARITT